MSDERKAEAAVENINTVPAILSLGLDEIQVDEKFNARKTYIPERIESLKDSIKSKGLMNPLQVMQSPKGEYVLIAGFTRYRALTEIAKENKKAGVKDTLRVPCRLVVPENEADARLLNLEENTQRDNLTSYEIACACAYIMETFGESGATVGKRIGIGKNHVNNYVRALRELHPDIKAAWADPKHPSHGMAVPDWLFRIASKDHETQWAKWEERLGITHEEEESEEETESDDSGSEAEEVRTHRRPGKTVLESAIEAVEGCDKSEDWKKGATAALRFAAGLTKKLPGVYDPKKKVKKGSDEAQADA